MAKILVLLIGAVFILAIILAPLILGVIALRKIDESNGRLRGRGLAIGAIVLGILLMFLVPAGILFTLFLSTKNSAPSSPYLPAKTPIIGPKSTVRSPQTSNGSTYVIGTTITDENIIDGENNSETDARKKQQKETRDRLTIPDQE